MPVTVSRLAAARAPAMVVSPGDAPHPGENGDSGVGGLLAKLRIKEDRGSDVRLVAHVDVVGSRLKACVNDEPAKPIERADPVGDDVAAGEEGVEIIRLCDVESSGFTANGVGELSGAVAVAIGDEESVV